MIPKKLYAGCGKPDLFNLSKKLEPIESDTESCTQAAGSRIFLSDSLKCPNDWYFLFWHSLEIRRLTLVDVLYTI